MRHRTGRRIRRLAVLAVLGMGLAAFGQFREYHVSGRVVDARQAPLEGVEITARDILSNRSFTLKTKKDGQFKFVGLPHAVYKVVFRKDGYAAKEDEWKLAAPQDAMKRIELPPVVLVSDVQIEEEGRLREMGGRVREAFERIGRDKDYDGAIAILTDVLAANPEDPNALYLIGLSYSKKRLYPEAIAALTKFVLLDPAFPAAQFELGVCHQNQGDKEQALAHYGKTLELDPGNTGAAYNAGLILFGLGRADEALARFEKALETRPDDPECLEMAGRCCINRGDYPKAVAYLERARALLTDPERAGFLDDLIVKLKEQIKK